MWYEAYQMQKDYASNNINVGSSMIWGCQWDQVMKFVDDKLDGAGNTFDVTTARTTSESTRHTGKLAATGNNINDKVQNIYDLEGNLYELTLEAADTSTGYRSYRGGTASGGAMYSAYRGVGKPSYSSAQIGSRVTLYIR